MSEKTFLYTLARIHVNIHVLKRRGTMDKTANVILEER